MAIGGALSSSQSDDFVNLTVKRPCLRDPPPKIKDNDIIEDEEKEEEEVDEPVEEEDDDVPSLYLQRVLSFFVGIRGMPDLL